MNVSATYYYLHDANKNVSELLDSSGNIMAHYEYSPFGKQTVASGSYTDNPFRFSTEYYEQETGLVYYNFRYYSPELGRWLNRDPIGEEGGWNLYGMVGNDAINNWDYLGLMECTPWEKTGKIEWRETGKTKYTEYTYSSLEIMKLFMPGKAGVVAGIIPTVKEISKEVEYRKYEEWARWCCTNGARSRKKIWSATNETKWEENIMVRLTYDSTGTIPIETEVFDQPALDELNSSIMESQPWNPRQPNTI
jgi:RHS repeat-associated protein